MWSRNLIIAAAVVFISTSSVEAQDASPQLRPSLALGTTNYHGDFNIGEVGVLARLSLGLESVGYPISAQLEANYHRFAAKKQPCPQCPDCICPPESRSEVAGVVASGQWNLHGAPGGPYLLGGVGGYAVFPRRDQRGRGALGFELGAGARGRGSSLLSELRYVRLQNSSSGASLVELVLGYRL